MATDDQNDQVSRNRIDEYIRLCAKSPPIIASSADNQAIRQVWLLLTPKERIEAQRRLGEGEGLCS